MRVTSTGQVTIPKHIREKLNIVPHSEVEFVADKNRVYLIKSKHQTKFREHLNNVRGSADVGLSTDEIMALTREE